MVTEQGEIMSEVAKSGRKNTVLEILRFVSPLAPSPMCHLIWVSLIKTTSHRIVIHKVEMMSFAPLGSLSDNVAQMRQCFGTGLGTITHCSRVGRFFTLLLPSYFLGQNTTKSKYFVDSLGPLLNDCHHRLCFLTNTLLLGKQTLMVLAGQPATLNHKHKKGKISQGT